MHLEDLKVGEWYVVLTQGAQMSGAPVCVKEISPPFVLVVDFMDDIMVVDTRVQQIGAANPKYVAKFRRMWKKRMAQKRAEAAEQPLCLGCGLPVDHLAEGPSEEA
jgi:hypothetical protein